INYLQLDCFVRDHSSGLKRFPLRRVVAVLTHRKLTTALHLLEGRYAQHASAASAADNHRATAFLHNAGEQLRAATRAFVYQNRNRTLVNLLVIVGSKKQRSSRSFDELAERTVRAEEVACDLNYLLGFAPRVAANVNYDARRILQSIEGLLELFSDRRLPKRQSDVSDARLQATRRYNCSVGHDAPSQRDIDLCAVRSSKPNPNGGPGLAFEDHSIESEVYGAIR